MDVTEPRHLPLEHDNSTRSCMPPLVSTFSVLHILRGNPYVNSSASTQHISPCRGIRVYVHERKKKHYVGNRAVFRRVRHPEMLSSRQQCTHGSLDSLLRRSYSLVFLFEPNTVLVHLPFPTGEVYPNYLNTSKNLQNTFLTVSKGAIPGLVPSPSLFCETNQQTNLPSDGPVRTRSSTPCHRPLLHYPTINSTMHPPPRNFTIFFTIPSATAAL